MVLLNRLEQLALQADQLAEAPNSLADIQERAAQLNDGLQGVMKTIAVRQQQFAERIEIRKQIQAAIFVEKPMHESARQMLAADQLAFYRQLFGEMFQFFTGSEQGRCVSFNLTVEELLFFIRLLLEEKVMDVGTLKAVFLFLSRHARTVGSETLSYESLRKKYSNVGKNAKESVGTLIERLAHLSVHRET